MKVLRDYQTKAIDSLAIKYMEGRRKMIFQLATGGGKTVTFAGLIKRFMSAPAFKGKKIVIAVHREELLKQARRTLYEWYGLIAQPITAGIRFTDPNADVYVTMVETANNRLKRNPRFFGDVGMFIVDEAHLANFTKLHGYFNGAFIVGFTATPIAASRRHPLKDIYEDIVCGIDIPHLIKNGSLVGDVTYGTRVGVDTSHMKIKNGDFDIEAMAEEYKAARHVQNCVREYSKNADGTKAIVFNITIDHSLLVTQAFIDAEYNCRHLDGETPKELRKEILDWFNITPGAILCNVGILTTGFDDTTVQTIIVNRATMSVSLWLQMTGRGSRPCTKTDKKFFTIIDLGGNVFRHGYWSDQRDWSDIFHNPDKPKEKKEGAAPIKNCDNIDCDAMIPVQCRTCPICGKVQDMKEVEYDKALVEIELLKANISVPDAMRQTAAQGYRPYHALYRIRDGIIEDISDKKISIDSDIAYALLSLYQTKVQEWCIANNTDYSQWHKDNTAKWFFDGMKKRFNWQPERLQLRLAV